MAAEPTPRWGHFSAPVKEQLYLLGGLTSEEKGEALSTLHVFDFHLEFWRETAADGPSPPPRLYSGASTSSGHDIFIYGGWSNGTYQGTLHHLDTSTLKWHQLATEGNGPMRKSNCAMVHHHKKLVLFGGYGLPSGPTQQGAEFIKNSKHTDGRGWSNELHTFDLKEGEEVFKFVCC